MKNKTLRFSKIYLSFFVAISTLLLFSSCGTTYYASGDTFYVSSIDSYGQYDIKGKEFFIESGMEDISEKDLQFKEFKNLITKSFIRQGAITANSRIDADIIVLLQYGISDPQTYQENIPIPIWGRTSIASSSTTTNSTSNTYVNANGSAYSTGGVIAGSVYGSSSTTNNSTSSTQYNYNYGITDVYYQTVTSTEYYRYCNVYAYDNKTKSNDMLWKTCISSTGSNGDLRETLPYLIYTGMAFYGFNTGKKITLCTKNNNSVNLLIDTDTKTTPHIIYRPNQSSSNTYSAVVTAVRFHPNATRIYLRSFGNYGDFIQVSKKTALKVNEQEYIITGTNAVFSPNKLAFEKNGQVYDFYMDFPALREDNIKTIRVVEPERNGWDLTIQLD